MLPIFFTCTHCTHRTLCPHQTKPPTMTGIYVSIIFTCTHCTHRTLYPQLLERKNKDALNLFGLHTSHTLPTASCKKKIWMLPIIFTCTHCTHRTLHPHQSKQPTMTGLYVSIIFTCTHRTHCTLHLARKYIDATYVFSPAHTAHTPNSTHIS